MNTNPWGGQSGDGGRDASGSAYGGVSDSVVHHSSMEAQPRAFPCVLCGYNMLGVPIGLPCPECGTPNPYSPGSTTTGSSGAAVTSMVLGIVGLATCVMYGVPTMILAPLAIVFFYRARNAVLNGEAHPSSLGMAKVGLICGWVGVGMVLLGLLMLGLVFVAGTL